MNTALFVDDLVSRLRLQVESGGIPLSDACWQVCLVTIGWPYVYSAWEAECTPKERSYRFRLCPSKTTIKTKCQVLRDNDRKADCSGCKYFPGGERTRCGDCRGWVDWILKQFGFDLYGDTVAAQWNHKDNWCAQGKFGTDPVPENVLVNIFIYNGSKWTHTGFYYRGSTCECSVDVQYFETMKKNRWTHWAVAKCFASDIGQVPKEPVKEKEPVKVNKTIRKGNYGSLVKECQTMLQKLGFDLGICGIDGDFGQATEKAVKAFQKAHGLSQDGVVGPKTWTALQEAVNAIGAAPPVVKYRVVIPNRTAEEADAILAQYPGSTKEIEGS